MTKTYRSPSFKGLR